jgi:hypothetical protein
MESLFPSLTRIKELKLNQISLSFDLETPNKFGSGIFSIGITPFSFVTGQVFEKESFYIRLDWDEVLAFSENVGDTLKWWMQQSDEARYEVISKGMPELHRGKMVSKDLHSFGYEEGLMHCLSYIMSVKSVLLTNGKLEVMGNGALFDIGKFEETLRTFNIIGGSGSKYPPKEFEDLCYKFWDILDLRSFRKMALMVSGEDPKKNVERRGTHHNAVDDAIFQAKMAIESKRLCMKIPNPAGANVKKASGD